MSDKALQNLAFGVATTHPPTIAGDTRYEGFL
jgi:hypothetical protein